MNQQRALCWGLAVLFVVGLGASTAQALPPFFKEFEAKYVKPDSDRRKGQGLCRPGRRKTAKCNVCHVAGKDKKARNAYGKQLSMLLKKDNFKAERLKDEADKVQGRDRRGARRRGRHEVGRRQVADLWRVDRLAASCPAAMRRPPWRSHARPNRPAPRLRRPPAPAAASHLRPKLRRRSPRFKRLGGTVQALAMNDDSLVVDFHLGGTALNDEGLANVKVLPKVVQLDLKDTQITDAGLANLAGHRDAQSAAPGKNQDHRRRTGRT